MKKILLICVFCLLLGFLFPEVAPAPTRGFTFTAYGWQAPYKDPVAVLDYTIDWSQWLGTDTITASDWSVTTGITIISKSSTTTETTVWLSGGTDDTIYEITNQITTAGGRITRQSFKLPVKTQ